MISDGCPVDGKTHPDPIVLQGEKRIKQRGQVIRRNPWTRTVKRQQNAIIGAGCFCNKVAAGGLIHHRLRHIDHQVDQHLQQLNLVATHIRQISGHIDWPVDPGAAQFQFDQSHCVVHQGNAHHADRADWHFAQEFSDPLDNIRRPSAIIRDLAVSTSCRSS